MIFFFVVENRTSWWSTVETSSCIRMGPSFTPTKRYNFHRPPRWNRLSSNRTLWTSSMWLNATEKKTLKILLPSNYQLGADIPCSYFNFRIIYRSRWNFTGYTWRQISTGRSWTNCRLLACSGICPRRQRSFYQQIKRGILTLSYISVIFLDASIIFFF